MASKDKLLLEASQHMEQAPLAAVRGNCEIRSFGGLLWNGSRSGLLIATESGVSFYAPKMGGFELESLAYAEITGISTGKSLLSGGTVSLATAGGRMKVTGIRDDDLGGFVATVRTRVSRAGG